MPVFPVPTVASDDGIWQMRFLATPVLQRLGPLHWQQLLQGMTVEAVAGGTTLFEAGDSADACYVLQSGLVRVHAGARSLAVLEPGVLFGEDALITGGCRNASVTLSADGRVGRLPAERFERWLLNAVIRPLAAIGGRTPLCIDRAPLRTAGCVHLPLARIRDPVIPLAAAVAYCVIGGKLRERWLAAFVLAQQGYDVLPLDGPIGLAPT